MDSVAVYLASYGGGLVDGDRIRVRLDVDADARLVVLNQASTKVFKRSAASGRHGVSLAGVWDVLTPSVQAGFHQDANAPKCSCQPAHCLRKEDASATATASGTDNAKGKTVPAHGTAQHLQATIGARGLLCFLPEPLVAFADANYAQRQDFRIHIDADDFRNWGSLLMLDWFTSGRKSRGETWAFQHYSSENKVFLCDDAKTSSDDVADECSTWSSPPLIILDMLELNLDERLDSSLSYHRAPYHVYATVLMVGPLVERMAKRLLMLAQTDKFHPQAARSSTKTTAQSLPPLLWSASSIDTAVHRCHASTCWHCERTRSQPNECSVGACLKIAAVEVEAMREFLNDVVFGEDVAALAGESSLFRRLL